VALSLSGDDYVAGAWPLKYRGFTIVAQYARYQVWALDAESQLTRCIDTVEEFDGFRIWDPKANRQHDRLTGVYDHIGPAKLAIDEYVRAAVTNDVI
jgi:hypothetical protein